jgi:FtsH-binding integral membrane protein
LKRLLLVVAFLVAVLGTANFLAQRWMDVRAPALPVVERLLLWGLEAAGLAGFFWVARGPSEPSASSRLAVGWAVGLAAWLFRGPVVSATLVSAGGLTRAEARRGSIAVLIAYLVCGIVLAWLGRPRSLPVSPVLAEAADPRSGRSDPGGLGSETRSDAPPGD